MAVPIGDIPLWCGAFSCLLAVAVNLDELPVSTLLAIFTLTVILVYLFWQRAQEKFVPIRYPATEWPRPLPDTDPRAGFPEYDPKSGRKSFLQICDRLIQESVEEMSAACEMPPAEVKWVQEQLEYNVKNGKLNRGLMVVTSGERILEHRGLPADSAVLAKLAVLGWCIEWMQAWLLVADDIMDDSEMRRGKPCWYRREHVQKIALNDAFMTEMLVFRMLKRHFWREPYYHELVDLFMETTFQTECGQLLDVLCANIGLEDFTVDRWTLIVKYKTAFYSFYLPVALGMIVAGVTDTNSFNVAREPLLQMGIYFQAQDDYLDAFGTPEEIGKIGTDIQDKKCGWLFVHAYGSLASPEQRRYLEDHYGKCKVGSHEENEIKSLYKDLKIEDLYREYEQKSYDGIMAMKATVEDANLPWSVFEAFLKKVYKRSK